MVRLNDYPSHDDLLQIDWHHAGFFDNPAGNTRAMYYGASSAPDVFFDGTDHVLGAGDSLSAYSTYRGIVNNHYNNLLSQFLIYDEMYNFDLDTSTATVTFTLEVAPGETISNPQLVTLRSMAYEDDLTHCCEPQTGNDHWNHIGRALGTEVPLTISNSGETQQYVGTFALDPAWVPANMHVIVLAQRDSNRRVMQAGEACRMYGLSVDNLTPTVTSSSIPVDFDVEVTYTGCVDDDVTVTLDKSQLPGDWDAEIVVGLNTFPVSTTFSGMTSGQSQPYAIRVIPGASAAIGAVSVETVPVTNPSNGVTESYSVFANTPAILYVNDDQGGASQPLYESAIADAGHFSFTHDVDTEGEPSQALLMGFDAVIWNTGQSQNNTISIEAMNALVAYLDAGGKMFLTSHGILNNYGTAPAFISNYLRVSAYQQDEQALNCTGVASDPIGDGLSFSVTGGPFPDFADNITANTGGVIWLLGQFGDVAVHYESPPGPSQFQTVFMTPALELAPQASRDLIVARVLDWFFPISTDADAVVAEAGRLALQQNAPNPFGATTSVRFAIPSEGPVSLDVYDIGGRRVVRLVDRVLPAGSHSVTWDGRDTGGARVASGVYLYRVTAGGQSVAKEMVLRK